MGSTRTQVFDKLNRDPETLSPLDIAEKLRPTFLVERILHNETMLRMSPEEQAWDYMELAIASRTNIAQKSHLMDHGIATLQGVVDNAKHRLNSAEQAAAMALAYEPALRRRLLAHTIDPQTIMTVHHNLCNLLARVMPEVNEVSGYRGFSGEIISACLWSNGDPQCFLHLSGPREERASLMGGHFSYNHDIYQLKDRNKWPIQIKNKTLKEGLGHYHDSIIPLRIKRTIAEEDLLYMVARGMISNRDVGRRITSGENLDLAMDATARSLLAIHDGEATEYDKQIVLRARRAAFKKLREQKQKRAQFMPWAKEQTQE